MPIQRSTCQCVPVGSSRWKDRAIDVRLARPIENSIVRTGMPSSSRKAR